MIFIALLLWGALHVLSTGKRQNEAMQSAFAEFEQQQTETLDERLNAFSKGLDLLREEVEAMRGMLGSATAENQKAIELLQFDRAADEPIVPEAETADEWTEASDSIPCCGGEEWEEIRNEVYQHPGFRDPSATPEQIAEIKAMMEKQVDAFQASLSEEQWEEVRRRTDETMEFFLRDTFRGMPQETSMNVKQMMEKQIENLRSDIERDVIRRMMWEAEHREIIQ